jgi:hypothetical protein
MTACVSPQECKACEEGFDLNHERGCAPFDASKTGWKGGCLTRDCQPCPAGAVCEGGNVDPLLDGWRHLIPRALGIGPSNTPFRKATVVHSGKKHVFWCDTGSGEFWEFLEGLECMSREDILEFVHGRIG